MNTSHLTATYAALLAGLLFVICATTLLRIWHKGVTSYFEQVYMPASKGEGTQAEYFIYILTLLLLTLFFGSGASLAFAYANGLAF